jgi:hypothetical protein
MRTTSNACQDRDHAPACTGYFDAATGWTGNETYSCACPCHDPDVTA